MSATLNVNNMTVVHAGSGGVSTATPDTCKTPTPAGPQPLPYPNVAQSSDASQVTTSVKVDGNGVMVKGSTFALSSGDEPGSALGIMSNKIKGPAEFTNLSTDVKFEGKAVARLSDPMGQNQGTPNASGPAEMQGPLVVMDASKIAQTQKQACDEVKKNEVTDHKQGALDAGMREKDYNSIRETCQQENVNLTFRDTNPSCIQHIEAGIPSKGHDVLTKTLPEANLQEWDKGSAGLVSTLNAKPGPGEMIPSADAVLRRPPLTGDYDMMDMIRDDGSRIPGESPRDISIRRSLNGNLPPCGDPPRQMDRVMHGCQSEYGNYLKNNPGEEPVKGLFKPESPLTAFDKDGKVYRLKTNEDVMNYYKCKGTPAPKEWNIQYK